MLVYGYGTLEPGNLINSRESFGIVQASGADGVDPARALALLESG